MPKELAVVGAGPKAAAIVARCEVLRSLGHKNVPNVTVFEDKAVGSAWSGGGGFSSGFLRLCTPGEKDVGFPYDEIVPWGSLSKAISPALFSRFSWSSFLVASARMPDWVDRGRSYPSHAVWAEYLRWVFDTAGKKIRYGKVHGVRRTSYDKWDVSYISEGNSRSSLFDGVVLTGAGRSRLIPSSSDIPPEQVFDSETFWARRNSIIPKEMGTTVTVIGAGGAAGAIVAWLAEKFAEETAFSILSVNPTGTLFPRGDGHAERRWFSDPSEWLELSVGDRMDLLKRTEGGVISFRNKNIIDQSNIIAYKKGKALYAERDLDEIKLHIGYGGITDRGHRTDYMINAIGFDPFGLLELVDRKHPLLDEGNEEARKVVRESMLDDLSMPPGSGFGAGLHVPSLCDLAQGPGMGNLGCLGLMAKRVVSPYL